MDERKKAERLRPILAQVESELEERVEEACGIGKVSDETTAELEKLSETFELAAHSARAAASLRRRIREARLMETFDPPRDEPRPSA
jgi:hypothetical protein